MMAAAAEGFDQFIVARPSHQNGRRGIGASAAVNVVTAVDAAVVEDHDDNRQMVTADGLDLHSAEAEGAVAFDGDHGLAANDSRADGVTHADAHYAPRSAVQTFARLVHVDDIATEIERVG